MKNVGMITRYVILEHSSAFQVSVDGEEPATWNPGTYIVETAGHVSFLVSDGVQVRHSNVRLHETVGSLGSPVSVGNWPGFYSGWVDTAASGSDTGVNSQRPVACALSCLARAYGLRSDMSEDWDYSDVWGVFADARVMLETVGTVALQGDKMYHLQSLRFAFFSTHVMVYAAAPGIAQGQNAMRADYSVGSLSDNSTSDPLHLNIVRSKYVGTYTAFVVP